MPVLLEASIEKADINLHIYKDIKSKIRSTFGFLWTEKSYGAYKKKWKKNCTHYCLGESVLLCSVDQTINWIHTKSTTSIVKLWRAIEFWGFFPKKKQWIFSLTETFGRKVLEEKTNFQPRLYIRKKLCKQTLIIFRSHSVSFFRIPPKLYFNNAKL